jgi:hypothetical protein
VVIRLTLLGTSPGIQWSGPIEVHIKEVLPMLEKGEVLISVEDEHVLLRFTGHSGDDVGITLHLDAEMSVALADSLVAAAIIAHTGGEQTERPALTVIQGGKPDGTVH